MIDLGLFAVETYVVWIAIGLVLCAAETFVPGAFLIWIGAAAVVVGAVEFFFPLAFAMQLLLLAALVIVFVLVGRRVYGSLEASSAPLPLSRAHAMIGQVFYLDDPIERGFGAIRVGDSVWRVAGADLPAGAKVRVVEVQDGALVRVEKA